jgi:peroxiredoxin
MRILSMRKLPLLLALSTPFLSHAARAVSVGEAAPGFTAAASTGKTAKLSDYAGKIVVLEWTNHGCPFVKKHYGSGNMQALQKELKGKGAVWLSVISSAPGTQGHSTPAEAEAARKEFGAEPTAILLDDSGKLGKLYGAQTTPHMFVIDQAGKLAYQGAIDDKPTPDPKDIKGARNYARSAVEALLAGKAVEVAQTKSYGCGVKYAKQ